MLSDALGAARALAADEAAEALRAMHWPRTWPPSPHRGWLWCESCPAALDGGDAEAQADGGEEGEEGDGAAVGGARGWPVSDECQRLSAPFGESRAGQCLTLGSDCPPPRRRRLPQAAATEGGAPSAARHTAHDELRR